ncbi:MAG TPA: erythromycin esterase family protein [Thermoanaerobaculia bacterium]|nr:erythromycin esterase family protein [Thermoanaerobaculia bacterium]HXT49956.1 erythromycin esterase family protein [Thermoanaerobaculia bacterium]
MIAPPLAAEELEALAAGGFPIQPGVWRLDGTDPELPTADLEPLRALVGKATLVGLGESVHTSGGYYETKDRLFRYLVEKLGFRVIAFETPWLDGETANAYVQSCDGDADTATAGFFGVWRSRELSSLLGWMCDWNRTHSKPKDRLSVYAFDIQYQAAQDTQALADFLVRLGLDPESEAFAGLERCSPAEAAFRIARPFQDDALRCQEATAAIAQLFASQSKAIAKKVGKSDFEWAKLRRAGLDAWMGEMFYAKHPERWRSFAARDQGMATVLLGIRAIRYPKSKIAVWAHNAHVAHDGTGWETTVMGQHLTAALGNKYVVVGLASREADIDWLNVGCGASDPPSPGASEQILHALGEEMLLVDLRATSLFEPGSEYELGWRTVVPARTFDALVYLDRSRKMSPLAWPSCQ